ncbi:MAG: hypothetical protein H8E31_06820, partial [Planctomycetes bacterium]|nr:hypothetical protein [Planctomycetota bacterium]
MASPPDKRRIGTILVDMGVLRQGQLQAALAEQRRSGGRLGAILLEREAVTGEDLARGLALQKGMDWVPAAELVAQPDVLAGVDPAPPPALGAPPLGLSRARARPGSAAPPPPPPPGGA